MKMRVAAARFVTADVLHLSFTHPSRPVLPAWTPGAHVDLRLPDGSARQYSLCGNPEDRARYEIAIKREDEGRGGSTWAHASLRVGVEAHVSAPRNTFPLAEGARRHVLVAGGIGVTPIAAMARALAARAEDFSLHFCARGPAEAPLRASLRETCGRRLVPWFSAEGRRFDPAAIGPYTLGAHLYVCGPGGLMDAARVAALARGWPEAAIHEERFQAPLDPDFIPEPFEARIASTGAVLHVPADRSLLAVLRDHAIPIRASCEQGLCGSCLCGYSEGAVIHRDSVIPLAERKARMAPCVSRARDVVTLDL
jgi:vanillate O-demethylase ferredoxin subunit